MSGPGTAVLDTPPVIRGAGQGRRGRFARPATPRAGAVALLTGVSALWLGFGYEVWPTNAVLAYVYRFDGQLRGDWSTSLPSSHWAVAHALGALPSWALESVVIVVWLVTLALLWTGWTLLAEDLGMSWAATAAAGLLLLPSSLDGIGSSQTLDGYMYPTSTAFALEVCSLAMVVRRRPLAAGLLLGLATLVHPGEGALAVVVFVPVVLWAFRARFADLVRMAVPTAIVAAPALIEGFVDQTGGAQLSARRRYELLAIVRDPYHQVFAAFPTWEWAGFTAACVLLLVGLVFLRRERVAQAFALLAAGSAVFIVAGGIAAHSGSPLSLIQAQPTRLSSFLVLSGMLLGAALLARLTPAAAAPALLAVFVGGQVLLRPIRGQVAAHAVGAVPGVTRVTIQAGLLLLALAVAALARRRGWRFAAPRGAGWATAATATAVAIVVVVHTGNRPQLVDPDLRAVAEHVRGVSRPGDLVLVPPGSIDFTVLSRRPTVVTLGIFRYGKGDTEWVSRMETLTGGSRALAVEPFRYNAVARTRFADDRYDQVVLTSRTPVCRYGARYVIVVSMRPDPPPWLTEVYRNRAYRLLRVAAGACAGSA